jgi:aminoglycoside/choline kinase family phosphotransferase
VPRRVRLVVCSSSGEPLGTLPVLDVQTPWWPDVEPVVAAAKERFDIDVVVLRLIDADGAADAMGGTVTYETELVGELPAAAVLGGVDPDVVGSDHLFRAPWARPGGVARQIAWADAALDAIERPRTGEATQVKSWNLSSVLRLPTAAGEVWCKRVPPFLGHEGTIIAMVGADDPSLVPRLLAADRATSIVLLDDVAGEDQWDAPEARLIQMVDALVRLQAAWSGRVDELLDAGLPDWRAGALPALARDVLERPAVREQLSPAELVALDAIVEDLPRRLADLDACGLPETLVHGDFHPGNWRFDGERLVLMDWGDTGVGHPMLDLDAFIHRVSDDARPRLLDAWFEAWHRQRPHADPARAAELIGPAAALRAAIIYQRFLDGIEPSERRYHEADVPAWLRRGVA